MMGQYPFAAIIGKVADKYGPWACSIIAGCLFFTGFGLFAREIAKAPDDMALPSASSFHHLVVYFFIAGLGSTFSYVAGSPHLRTTYHLVRCFSSLFAASKNFPEFIGMASGVCATLFSLSPMLISILASRFFSHPDEDLDVIRFLRFLAVTCGAVHLFGGFTLHIIQPPDQLSNVVLEDFEWSAHADERTALLQGTRDDATEVEVGIVPVPVAKDDSIFALFKDRTFWVLAFIMFVMLGSVSLSHLYHPSDGVDFCWQE
jgi:MFS family permease